MDTPALSPGGILGLQLCRAAQGTGCGSLSNVGGGVLASGKQAATFHNSRPRPTYSSAPSGDRWMWMENDKDLR